MTQGLIPNRRAFLAGLAAASLPSLSWADAGSPAYLAAGKLGDDFTLHGLSRTGESLFQIALPARGHAAAAHPTRPEAVAFARRPGIFALVINCATGTVTHRLAPPAGHQFNGHGAFSADGSLLMTSEVVADGSAGRIALWDARSYTRLTDWPSGGIGPHDIRRLTDGRIVVANGGIQTDPSDRTKLNIATMRPNLTLLSAEGGMLDQIALGPDLQQNSIRHLALSGDTIAFAMQWEGDPAVTVPLLGLWQPGSAPRLCDAAPQDALAMKGYAGSIAATDDRVLITSAKGGAAMVFGLDGAPLATHRRSDLSGAARLGDAFLLTDGLGATWTCDADKLTALTTGATLWDNHLVALT